MMLENILSRQTSPQKANLSRAFLDAVFLVTAFHGRQKQAAAETVGVPGPSLPIPKSRTFCLSATNKAL